MFCPEVLVGTGGGTASCARPRPRRRERERDFVRDWGVDGALLELSTGVVMGGCAMVVGAVAETSCWELDAWDDMMKRLGEKVNSGDEEKVNGWMMRCHAS